MKNMIKTIAAGLTLVAGNISNADSVQINVPSRSPVEITSVTAGGSGCVGGNVVIQRSAYDLGTILFDSFYVQTGRDKSSERKSCNLVITLKVPSGYEVGLPPASASGIVQTPGNSAIALRSEFFFLQGGRSQPESVKLSSRNGSAYNASINVQSASQLVWSGCRAAPVLRMNVSLTAQSNSTWSNSVATLEEIKLRGPSYSGMALRRCK